jgi:hypothetical protein
MKCVKESPDVYFAASDLIYSETCETVLMFEGTVSVSCTPSYLVVSVLDKMKGGKGRGNDSDRL